MPPVRMRGDGRKAKDPKKTLLRLLSYLKKYIPTLILVLICIVTASVVQTVSSENLGKLVDAGLNGIETDHPEIAPDTVPLAVEAAKTFNLYHSGGTDHTGPMSACGGDLAIPAYEGISEEDFQILIERRLG